MSICRSASAFLESRSPRPPFIAPLLQSLLPRNLSMLHLPQHMSARCLFIGRRRPHSYMAIQVSAGIGMSGGNGASTNGANVGSMNGANATKTIGADAAKTACSARSEDMLRKSQLNHPQPCLSYL